MIAVGLVIKHQSGGIDMTAADSNALFAFIFSAGSMLTPMLATIFTQLIFKEKVFSGCGISLRFNRWWWIGWLLMAVLALATLGISLLMPGESFAADSEALQQGMAQLGGGGVWTFLAISVFSGMIVGATLNAVFAFGEEIAWRGFLIKELAGKKFLTVSLIIGVIWGFWHFPLILLGHNYPQHPVPGVFLMVVMCVLLTPILMYFRKKSGTVLVPAIMHGTFNGVIGISNILVEPANDLLIGGPGLAGFIVLLLTNVCLFLYDHYCSKEDIYLREL
jgi:hypothetical protein